MGTSPIWYNLSDETKIEPRGECPMIIVKQMSLFDIQQLLDMQSSRRFDTIFATIDV